MSQDPRQLPTLPVLVHLDLVTGRTMRGTVSLSITSATHAGPETLEELLNASRRLMPVQNESGDKGELVARDAIVLVRVMSEIGPRPTEDASPTIDLVHIELATGKAIDGALLRAQHQDGTRLSDYFNSEADFFAVEDGGGIVYVNKRHVISINI